MEKVMVKTDFDDMFQTTVEFVLVKPMLHKVTTIY